MTIRLLDGCSGVGGGSVLTALRGANRGGLIRRKFS